MEDLLVSPSTSIGKRSRLSLCLCLDAGAQLLYVSICHACFTHAVSICWGLETGDCPARAFDAAAIQPGSYILHHDRAPMVGLSTRVHPGVGHLLGAANAYSAKPKSRLQRSTFDFDSPSARGIRFISH